MCSQEWSYSSLFLLVYSVFTLLVLLVLLCLYFLSSFYCASAFDLTFYLIHCAPSFLFLSLLFIVSTLKVVDIYLLHSSMQQAFVIVVERNSRNRATLKNDWDGVDLKWLSVESFSSLKKKSTIQSDITQSCETSHLFGLQWIKKKIPFSGHGRNSSSLGRKKKKFTAYDASGHGRNSSILWSVWWWRLLSPCLNMSSWTFHPASVSL